MYGWGHLHNEFYETFLEQGAIGLGLVGWALWDSICQIPKILTSPLGIALSGLWMAFLLNSLLNFPAHLWVLASFGLLAYSGIYRLAVEDRSWP